MRVTLADGQWVELHDELSHGETKRLQRAILRAGENPAEAGPEIDTEFFAVYVVAWSLLGVADLPADIGARLPLIDRLPESMVSTVAVEAARLWKGRADPNASTAS